MFSQRLGASLGVGACALVIAFFSLPARAYYGRHSVEAVLSFEGVVDAPLSGEPDVRELNREGSRKRKQALERVGEQVQHLMGIFQSESFRKEFGYPGVLGESHEIRFTRVEEGSERGRKRLGYAFKGTVVFQKEAFSGHGSRLVPIKLPFAPDRIYTLGWNGRRNSCTDEHYNSEGDFWYFWDPDLRNCPLRGNGTDVLRVTGRLERMPNTESAYPEYDRLYGDNGNGEALDIAVFLGYIEDVDDFTEPRRRDEGARALRFVVQDLKQRGFRQTERLDAFREYKDGRLFPGINFFRKFEKRVTTDLGSEVVIRVQVLLADTAVTSKDVTFHRRLVAAFEGADLVIYDGHSGLGGNLDLGSLPEFVFNPKKYQIFFFNGCSSYPYFNGKFFEAKGGSRNLEIVLSGLPTFTATAGPNVVAFMDRFLEGRALSYQNILSWIEKSNEDWGTYLTGVKGEEDNRWKPR